MGPDQGGYGVADEITAVATAVISVISALCGVGLQWVLGNITSDSQARRSERLAAKQRLQEGYIKIIADTDLFLRSVPKGGGNNERLSLITATVDLMAGPVVEEKFQILEGAIEKLLKVADGTKTLVSYQKSHLSIWEEIVAAKQELIIAMRAEVDSLRNFSS